MKRPFAILMLSVCTALAAHAQGIVEWQANVARWQSAEWDCGRGETLRLMPSFLSGRNAIDLSGLGEAAFHWQTNGMGGLYWSVPARIDTGSRPHRLVADFEPWMDCGAAKYDYFFRAGATNGPVQYRAHGTIRMRGAPGETPNALPLPVQVLDFAKIAWTNAPWGEGGGTDGEAVTNIVEGIVRDGGYTITNSVRFAGPDYPRDSSITIVDGHKIFLDNTSLDIVAVGNSISIIDADLWLDSWDMLYGGEQSLPDYIDEKTAPLAKSADLGTAAYRNASEFATATNLPPLSASSTVGDLVDAVNAIVAAMRKEEP